MAKRDLIGELKELELREIVLKEICSGPFLNEEDGKKYVETHKKTFLEFKKVRERIREIKWELMTPEEQKEKKEYLKKLRNKFLGE